MKLGTFSDLLGSISERGRQLLGLGAGTTAPTSAEMAVALAQAILSRRGEAAGIALASALLAGYASLSAAEKLLFFRRLAKDFGADRSTLDAAVAAYQANPTSHTAQDLHDRAEPRRQELLRRINRASGGTRALVAMRTDLLGALAQDPELEPVDHDFLHLLGSWFNRGFLSMRQIDWRTQANILEKIIKYEAVHAINDWDDLRRRTEPEDRRCFAFFHPALVDEPLIFVEVALTTAIPEAIAPLLARSRKVLPVKEATTAVFYSISNTQAGLKGVSFGNFLIKQVAEELKRDFPGLTIFVTLSPAPNFARWLDREIKTRKLGIFTDQELEVLPALENSSVFTDPGVRATLTPLLSRAAAIYYLDAKNAEGRPVDPVARFHLGNGARLERINCFGDLSSNGLRQSYGLMVNYLYDLEAIERNHEAFADTGLVAFAPEVARLKSSGLRSRSLPAASKKEPRTVHAKPSL